MFRDELTYSTLWQGDPFSCSKTFGKLACKLCQKERVALLRHSWSDGANMLNDRSEIHGICRHTARFHRLCMRLRYLDVSANEIELLSILIARNCTLLSNQSLSIRVSACQGLTSAFQFLAFVGTVHEVESQNSSLVPVKKSVCLPILAEHVFSNCRIYSSTLSHRFLFLRHDCDVNSEISFRVTHYLGTINHSRVMLPIDSFSFETCFSLHVSLFIHV
jgi:hypothetical protein